MVKQHGGEKGGMHHAPSALNSAQDGGRRRHRSKRRGSRRSKRGGDGVIATAAVPFGLLALQRYFKGNRTAKRGVKKFGNTFKRTFRRRH